MRDLTRAREDMKSLELKARQRLPGRSRHRADQAQTTRTCIYGHLEGHHVNDPAVSHLEMDDNVPGREHELGRPRHAMSVMSALAL